MRKNDISLSAAVAQGKAAAAGDSSTQVSSTQEDKSKSGGATKDNNENGQASGAGDESAKGGGKASDETANGNDAS